MERKWRWSCPCLLSSKSDAATTGYTKSVGDANFLRHQLVRSLCVVKKLWCQTSTAYLRQGSGTRSRLWKSTGVGRTNGTFKWPTCPLLGYDQWAASESRLWLPKPAVRGNLYEKTIKAGCQGQTVRENHQSLDHAQSHSFQGGLAIGTRNQYGWWSGMRWLSTREI